MDITNSRKIFITILENRNSDLSAILRSMPQGEVNGCLQLALRFLQRDTEDAIKAIESGEYDAWLAKSDEEHT